MDILTHDIKNLNQGVCGYLELMTMMPDTSETQRRFLEETLSYVRMSSQLIMSIETGAIEPDEDVTIRINEIINGAKERLITLNRAPEIDLQCEGFDKEELVMGNLLLVDLFLYIMDFMVKRSSGPSTIIKIKKLEKTKGYLKVSVSGNMQPLMEEEKRHLFSTGTGSHTGRGKLLLCSSIAERFGGSVVFLTPEEASSITGEFIVTLREAEP